jgi:phosphoribosylformylglycinamidine synthase
MKTDCNARYVYLNPREGTKIAVAEAARNIVCSGGVPLAITNCLNFGNPYKPEIYWQFANVVEGMREACIYFNTPVTGGNVSFYNESPEAAVYPTPTIGMIGLVEDLNDVTTSYFKETGDFIYLVGEDKEEMGGSEYLKVVHTKVVGDSPQIDFNKEKLLHDSILSLINKQLINSAHDVSEGGIACCIAECCIINEDNKIGAEVTIPIKTRADFSLFSESQSRIVVSVSPRNKERFESVLREFVQPFQYLGKTGGESLKINDSIDLNLDKIADLYYNTIQNIMKRED